MTPLCLFLMLAAFAAGIVATVFLWAACTVSGAQADAETPIEE